MDKQTKTNVKNLVLSLRDDFEKEIENRLSHIGIYKDREWKDGRSLPHLAEDELGRKELDKRRRVAAFIKREEKLGLSLEEATSEFIKECSYTWINRLLGLKCMECQGIIDEIITTRPEFGNRSKIHRDFRETHSDTASKADDGLTGTLFSVFEEVTDEIKILFDPDNEYSLIIPRYAMLKKSIEKINTELEYDSYRADDFLGWVYQYFNSREKNKVDEEVRTNKKKISCGSDIINVTQLYTEKYMVHFLVENSLGAMWMEMYPDSHLTSNWEYFVKDSNNSTREPKPVKEISFLDPACGSGHFLLYAFDLYYDMYLEEGVIPKEQIPDYVLKYNLHGIDIDQRAIQLTALGLYMKAKFKNPDSKVQHMNLVSADAIMQDKEILDEFLQEFEGDRTAQKLIRTIWEGLENVRELGSLLKLEEQIDAVIEQKKDKRLDFYEDSTQKNWNQWKYDILNSIKRYYEKASLSFDLNKQMFANEAYKGVQLLDLLEQRYDVVATNPPYRGKSNIGGNISEFIEKYYPKSKYDLYSCFLERANDFNKNQSFVALVCQNTFMFTSHYTSFRNYLVANSWIRTFAHLGPGAFEDISGIVVNTVLIITKSNYKFKENVEKTSVFLRCVDHKDKSKCLLNDKKETYYHKLKQFSMIPGMPFSYWVSDSILNTFATSKALEDSTDKSVAEIRGGMSTSNNDKFLRLFWEVEDKKIGKNFRDFLMGDGGPKWYHSNNNLINWKNNGEKVKEYAKSLYGTETRTIKNQKYYYKEGLSYNPISDSGIRVKFVPKGAIYSNAANGIFVIGNVHKYFIMAFLNSKVANYFLKVLNPSVNANPGDLKRIPFKYPDSQHENYLLGFADQCVNTKKSLLQYTINDREFQQTGIQWGYNQIKGD